MNDAKKWLKQQGIKPMRAAVFAVISLVAVAVGYKNMNWVLDLDNGSFEYNHQILMKISDKYERNSNLKNNPPILLANIKHGNEMFKNYKYVIDPRVALFAAQRTQFIFQTESEAEENKKNTFIINVNKEKKKNNLEIEHKWKQYKF